RVLVERQGRRLQEEARQRERDAALPRRLDVAADDRVELGDVRPVEVRHVRDERGRERHALGNRPTEVRERLALDRAPLLEPGQRGRLHAHRRQRLRDGGLLRGHATVSWSGGPCPRPLPPSSSNVTSTAPTLTVCPACTWIFATRPATGDGISTVALSVSTSSRGASSRTRSPSWTSTLTISASARPSPRSGSTKGRAIAARRRGSRGPRRRRARRRGRSPSR